MRHRHSQRRIREPLALWLLVVGMGSAALAQETDFQSIPSPRPSGWITDLTGTVSEEARRYINQVGDEVHQLLGREMCVVVIGSTSGRNHREFATDLFNHWGVGSPGIPGAPGVWRDNGILMLVAVDDRWAEIVLGSGIDDREQVRIAQQIIDDIVVPNFRAGESDSALYQGFRACATRLYSVTDLQSPPQLPSVSGRPAPPLRPLRQARGPITWWPWLAGAGLAGGLGLVVLGRYYLRYRPRYCPHCQIPRTLLEEDQDDLFLDEGEQLEEHLGSVDYDVWACLQCDDVLRLRYGRLFTRYSRCPKCHYVTVNRIETTLVAATYTHGGKVRVVEDCEHCSYHHTSTYRTPKKVKPSSSGSSSGGSFGGGSGGGSSGFSGGSSSGGGAGGGW